MTVRILSICTLVCALFSLPGVAMAQDTGTISGTVTASRASSIPNTLVYLETVEGEFAPPAEPAIVDQQNMEFVPFLTPIVVGTTVRFLNNDAAEHNVFSPDNEGYDLGNWNQGEHRDHVFATAGVYTQLCRLHPQMVGYVAVVQNPYFAVTGDDGAFEITGVPAGTYNVAVWNERKEAAAQSVTIEAGGAATGAIALE